MPSKHVNEDEGGGGKNPQNHANVVYEWTLFDYGWNEILWCKKKMTEDCHHPKSKEEFFWHIIEAYLSTLLQA